MRSNAVEDELVLPVAAVAVTGVSMTRSALPLVWKR